MKISAPLYITSWWNCLMYGFFRQQICVVYLTCWALVVIRFLSRIRRLCASIAGLVTLSIAVEKCSLYPLD